MKRPWKVEIRKTEFGSFKYFIRIVKSNGELWGMGEGYNSRRAALHAANALAQMVAEEEK